MVKIHLSRLLGEKRWTQKDLADATGIRPSTINEWYHELVPRLNVDHIDKICEALDCTITDLLEYIPNERKTTGKYLILEEHGNRKQKKEKELSDREAVITRKELMAEAKNTLAEKKLPVSLAEVLNYADADTCNDSISAVEKAFQEAVEAAVNERLKGGTPPKKAPEGENSLEKQIEAAMARGF